MVEYGINGKGLSHTQRMETKIQDNENSTKANPPFTNASTVLLSSKDAEEYKAYKRQRKVAEIMSAVARSEANLLKGDNIQRVCERAVRLKQTAVKIFPSALTLADFYLKNSAVGIDCVIGGTGETLPKVKQYEAKLAVKKKAREITLIVTPSLIETCRYSEIKREIKRIIRTTKKAKLKIWADNKYPFSTLARLARIAGETGAKYFSIPYFEGCERLRFDLRGDCRLEVSEVETQAQYKKLLSFGVGRIVTDKIWDMYSEWMLEAEKIDVVSAQQTCSLPVAVEEKSKKTEETPQSKEEVKTETEEQREKPAVSEPRKEHPYDPERDYRCRLEGSRLKFF